MVLEEHSLNPSKAPTEIYLVQLLLIVYLGLFTQVFGEIPQVFLPLLPALDGLKSIHRLGYFIYILLIISALLAILRYHFYSLVLGLGVFWIMIADRIQFSNNLSYAACLLILCGIVREDTRWAFRMQVSLLYFGAGLNKLLDSDWLSGQYFENFAQNVFHVPFYDFLSGVLPELVLAKCFCYAVILFEFSASVAFLFGIQTFLAVLTAYIFHGTMLLMTKGALSILFFYLMGCSFILLINYPKTSMVVNYPHRFQFFMGALKRIDFDRSFLWEKDNSKPISLKIRGKSYAGFLAFLNLLFYHKYAQSLFLLALGLLFKIRSLFFL